MRNLKDKNTITGKLCVTELENEKMIDEKKYFENLTKEKGEAISKLYECAYLRNVYKLQHRMIHEFSWFVEQVIFSDKPEFEKYKFDWISDNALETWISKFHEYCKEEYKDDYSST